MEELGSQAADTTAPQPFTNLEHGTVGALYFLFCICGTTLNLLAVIAFYKDAKLFKGTQPWLHIQLCVCNMAVVAPVPLSASSAFTGRWLYGAGLCQFYGFEGMVAGLAAINAVVAMCVERYVATWPAFQTKYHVFYSWSFILVIGNSIFWSVMPLIGWSRYALDLTGSACLIGYMIPDDGYISYIMCCQVLSIVVPLVFGVTCLWFAAANKGQGQLEGEGQVSDDAGAADGEMVAVTEKQLRRLCYVFLVFVILGWGPFAYLVNVAIFSDVNNISMFAAVLPGLTCKGAVSLYPIAYIIMSPRFKTGVLSMVGIVSVKQD